MPDQNQIQVHLPDGSIKQLPAGSTAHDVAMSISPRLAAAAIVARIKPVHTAADTTRDLPGDEKSEPGEQAMYAAPDAAAERLVDLSAPLTEDVHLQLLTEKDADALKVVRHSAAHVMATAVLELFPETKLGHGPATDAASSTTSIGPRRLLPKTLRRSKPKMAEVVGARRAVRPRIGAARARAWSEFKPSDDFMKAHFVERFTKPGEEISLLPQRQLRRFLPRAACAFDRAGEGVQGAVPRRRLLAGRREEPATAAHLRHGVFLARRSWSSTLSAWKRRSGAIIACWASSWTCSPSRSLPGRG